MHVHQVLVGASPGDAVTQIALAMDDLLDGIVPTSTWALHLDPRSDPRIRPVWHMPPTSKARADDVVIYHSSIGEPLLADMVMRRPERLVVHYHNITPPHFFAEIDPRFARLLACGRSELRQLVGRAEMVLADSPFNAQEITALADVPVRVTPPPVDHSALTRIEPHAPTMRHFAEGDAGHLIFHLGQLLPHKRPADLVGAMHILNTDLGVPAAMVLAGPTRNESYARALRRHVEDLGLGNVWIAGERTPEELAAFFRSATLFATASAHEGFCVPIVEAFSFGVPVLARDVAALPETVGGGGVLVPADGGPALYAEAMARLLADAPLRAALSKGAEARCEELSLERCQAAMLSALGEVLVA